MKMDESELFNYMEGLEGASALFQDDDAEYEEIESEDEEELS